MKNLTSVSRESHENGHPVVSRLTHPRRGVRLRRETGQESEPDFFARRAMVLIVPYDLFPAVEFRIRESGGHIAIMERQHKRGQYRLTVSVPSQLSHTFTQYENHT